MKNNRKRAPIGGVAEIMWIMGIVLCSLGVCLSANSGFGVSMVAAPAFVLFNRLKDVLPWLTYGTMDYIFQGVVVVLTALVCRRFKWKYLMAFGTAVLHGLCLDMWRLVFGTEVYATMGLRLVSGVMGAVITALAISMFLRTYLPQQAYELIVKEISERFNLNISKVKWFNDIIILLFAIVMMLVLFGQFDLELVGVGTVVITLVNTPLIVMWGKGLDRFFELTSRWPRFRNFFEKHFN